MQRILAAGYADGYRVLHRDVAGFTFPTWNPHLRLDYVFVSSGFTARLQSCEVVTSPAAKLASDHFPLLVEVSGR